MTTPLIQYPAGALLRVAQICGTPERPGLLPISRVTWWRWVRDGKVPRGINPCGSRTTAWPIEAVLAVRDQAVGEAR